MLSDGPVLIVLEGLDALGKTTQAKILAERLGVPYIKGGGWFGDSNLATRASREGNRDRYFSLMQLKQVREIAHILRNHKESEGIIGIVDRFILVDVAHILSRSWNEEGHNFAPEAEELSRKTLDRYLSLEIHGIVLDTEKPDLIKERIRSNFRNKGIDLPFNTNELIAYLKHSDPTDADTLERFCAKRAAWRWCANYLNWPLVSAEGTESETTNRLLTVIEGNIINREQETGKPIERNS